MLEERKVSEKIDKHTAAVEYILTIVADVETFSAVASDYITLYNDFKAKYNIVNEDDIDINKLESEIDENDIINLKQKAYAVRAHLVKLFSKVKAFANTVNYDLSEIERLYNEIKKNIIIKDIWLEEILYHINLMIQKSLLSGVFDVIRRYGVFTSVEKA